MEITSAHRMFPPAVRSDQRSRIHRERGWVAALWWCCDCCRCCCRLYCWLCCFMLAGGCLWCMTEESWRLILLVACTRGHEEGGCSSTVVGKKEETQKNAKGSTGNDARKLPTGNRESVETLDEHLHAGKLSNDVLHTPYTIPHHAR